MISVMIMNSSSYEKDNFEEIWRRVAVTDQKETSAPAAPRDESAELAAFMDEEATDAAQYAALASMCRDAAVSKVLHGISAEEREHVKRLQTAYFLIKGDTYVPIRKPFPTPRSMLGALRARYWEELQGETNYRAAAKAAKSVSAGLYESLADDEHDHAARLAVLIQHMLC